MPKPSTPSVVTFVSSPAGEYTTVVFLPEQPAAGAPSRLTTIQGLEANDVVTVSDDLATGSAVNAGAFAGLERMDSEST